jgi:hypothetical protein
VTRLAFLSPHEADVGMRSPLRGVQSDAFLDVSHLGKLEVRGAVPDDALPLGPGRGLVILEGETRAERDRFAALGCRVYDMTAGLAALEIQGEQLLWRLTELDPATLPAVGAILRDVPAVVEPRGGGRFRLFVPTELGHYVAETIDDLARGLR